MRLPPGFKRQSVVTPLGTMAYSQSDPTFWLPNPEDLSTLDPSPMVFFHGFGGGSSQYEWSKVYPAFASQYRVMAPDLVGWGESDHPAKDYTLSDYLESLTAFLMATCPAPAIVVASSLTAAMMIRVAIDHPERVKQMVLVAPTGLSDFGKDFRQSLFAQIVQTPWIDRAIYWAGIANATAIQAFLEQRQFANANQITPEIVSAYLESAQKSNAEYAALSFVRGDLCFDLSEFMPQLTVPTFILWGEEAQFTDSATGRRLADLNPTAIKGFEVLPKIGLTPQLECPAVTIGLLRKYLADCPG